MQCMDIIQKWLLEGFLAILVVGGIIYLFAEKPWTKNKDKGVTTYCSSHWTCTATDKKVAGEYEFEVEEYRP